MRTIFLFLCFLLLAVSCRNDETPKPRAYVRIALPEKAYQQFDSLHPYSFEYPRYALFTPDVRTTAEPYWGDIVFPDFQGRIHLSYKPVEDRRQLIGYMEDARTFVHRHIPKATAIRDEIILHEDNRVFGVLYQIRGKEAASPLQFFATDSTDHFLRGALYFHVAPNNDSLAPVIDFLEKDIRHLFATLKWQ